jgi:hypothetical protein
MAIADDAAQEQARLEKMLAEFQAAQRRRLVKRHRPVERDRSGISGP